MFEIDDSFIINGFYLEEIRNILLSLYEVEINIL